MKSGIEVKAARKQFTFLCFSREGTVEAPNDEVHVKLAKGIGSQVEVISINGPESFSGLRGLRSCLKLPENWCQYEETCLSSMKPPLFAVACFVQVIRGGLLVR